jgi:hypothetical protein
MCIYEHPEFSRNEALSMNHSLSEVAGMVISVDSCWLVEILGRFAGKIAAICESRGES